MIVIATTGEGIVREFGDKIGYGSSSAFGGCEAQDGGGGTCHYAECYWNYLHLAA